MTSAHWRLFWVIVAAGIVSNLVSARILRPRSADVLTLVPREQ
jgi:pheromone shutdown protein TraB